MVRDYNVWESFNRDNEHGFYIMSQARAIVSHRLVVRTIDSWLVHLTLRKSDWWRVFRSLGQLSWDMKLEPTSTFIMRNPPKIAWAVMKVCEISKSGIPSYVWNAAICHYDSVGYDYNKASLLIHMEGEDSEEPRASCWLLTEEIRRAGFEDCLQETIAHLGRLVHGLKVYYYL